MSSEPRFVIYSDGACSGNPGPGGWGSIVANIKDGWVRELGGHEPRTTNNRMELIGSLEALRVCGDETGDVVVLTDSVYVIRGITQWVWGWQKRGWKTAEGADVLNQDVWQDLMSAVGYRKKFGKIEWRYVRGHMGTKGNERVDRIAVAFSKREYVELYDSELSTYSFDVEVLPPEQEIPEMKGTAGPKAKPVAYLSIIGGVAQRHSSWAECERRVKGQSGAKFKKAMSEEEVADILKSWGAKL